MPGNSIAQITLFDQIENTSLGDLMHLELCLKHMDNDILLNTLDKERRYGRNDFPNKVMWCCAVSQFLFQRLQVNQMRRELAGNQTLRKLVGLNDCEVQLKTNNFDDIKVPSSGVFTNFLNKLIVHQDLLDDMLNNLRKKVFISIPEYGRQIAGDGKYFDSYSPNAHKGPVCKDQRAEHDAKYSKKNYTYKGEDGLKHTKSETHYGFRKHTLVDVSTELSICSIFAPANEDEKKHMTALLAKIKISSSFFTVFSFLDPIKLKKDRPFSIYPKDPKARSTLSTAISFEIIYEQLNIPWATPRNCRGSRVDLSISF